MMVELLAVLSVSAAAGMRIALPLLVIGLLNREQLWNHVPLLQAIRPPVLIAILTSWSLFELFGSKQLLGQRVLQLVELVFSPLVGGLLAWMVVQYLQVEGAPDWLLIGLGGTVALVLKVVQVGWFFRLQGMPLPIVLLEDVLCVFLVLFAFSSPQEGGLIAMLLLWLAIRSSSAWRFWYRGRSVSETTDRGDPPV